MVPLARQSLRRKLAEQQPKQSLCSSSPRRSTMTGSRKLVARRLGHFHDMQCVLGIVEWSAPSSMFSHSFSRSSFFFQDIEAPKKKRKLSKRRSPLRRSSLNPRSRRSPLRRSSLSPRSRRSPLRRSSLSPRSRRSPHENARKISQFQYGYSEIQKIRAQWLILACSSCKVWLIMAASADFFAS